MLLNESVEKHLSYAKRAHSATGDDILAVAHMGQQARDPGHVSFTEKQASKIVLSPTNDVALDEHVQRLCAGPSCHQALPIFDVDQGGVTQEGL